jgi:CRISPR-associated endonuclease/helicase Cas3
MMLYAKSQPKSKPGQRPRQWPTLESHTDDVCMAMNVLLGKPDSPTRLALSILRFLKLSRGDFGRLWLNAMVAAALHDIGKANDGFQAAVGNPIFEKGEQVIRHEHLSAMWLAYPVLASWMHKDSDPLLDYDVILSAVATHHLKARRDGTTMEVGFGGATSKRLGCNAILEGIRSVLAVAAIYLRKDPPNVDDFPILWKPGASIYRDEVVRRADRVINRQLKSDEQRRRLLLAIRSLLIAADAAGSGLVREERPVAWIEQHALQPEPLSGPYVRERVIDERIRQLEDQWRKEQRRRGEQPNAIFKWSDFQDAAAGLNRRALLLAACGAGKTLAAWRWIEAQMDRERDVGRTYGRVLFLYPTRGTATEGFRDYVSWAPEADAALVHGTAAYDLEGMFSNPKEPDERKDKLFAREEDSRLFALAQWPKRIFSATVDAFLGAMANQYGPICLLPVLADSVVVIDEVHSFSESMFAALRCLLERFDLPVLCMTASLPNERRDVLEKLGLEVFPRDRDEFEDLSRASDHKRYRVYAADCARIEDIASEALREDKRVLWVVNRVDECQRRYGGMIGADGRPRLAPPDVLDGQIVCYHSRFRLCDRRGRHNAVVEEFQRKPRRAALVIATQVCEMSLDLDADVLISEVAPVPALIQRMGRCCREKNPGKRFGEVYLYSPEQNLPYEKLEIEQGEVFRDELVKQTAEVADNNGAVSQNHLSDKLKALGGEVEPDRYTAFWDSGFWAFPTEFRETDEFTLDCVLQNDIEKYTAARNGRKPETPGYIVPVPRKLLPILQAYPRLHPLLVAPDELYDTQAGYRLPEVTSGEEK